MTTIIKWGQLYLTIIVLLFSFESHAQQSLWVGQSFRCDATSAVMGLTSDVSWTTSGGYLSLSGSGFSRNVTVTQYYSGNATVKCSWKYRLYSGDTWKTQTRSWVIRCNDNPASIFPSELILSQGEMAYVSYSHAYDNSYVSAANAYFSSSNTNIATVSGSGLVTAVAPGTTYVTLYSKISSTSPYCKVTVRAVQPQSASIPTNISVTTGQAKQVSVNVLPSNATVTSIKWESDDASIATINSSGVLTGVKHGTTKVRCIVNNSIYSNDASVTVSKATLSLSADKKSGLMEAGTTVQLTANDNRASIHYTLDGSTPSESSRLYSSPIIIDRNVTLKAIACHEDFNNSDILVREYEVTSLKIIDSFPKSWIKTVGDYVIPSITFNEPIDRGKSFDNIKLLESNSDDILDELVIAGNTLFIIPNHDMVTEGTQLTLTLPEKAIQSINSKEHNMVFKMSWNATGSDSPYCTYATDVYTGSSYTSSFLASNGNLFHWGAFPTERGGWNYPHIMDSEVRQNVAKSCNSDNAIAYIDVNGSLWMWGYNDWGCIGDGNKKSYYDRNEPYKVMDNIKEVSCGGAESHTMALTNDNVLYVWGSNFYGQLGLKNVESSYTPVKIMSDVKHIQAIERGSYAIKNDGTLWFWGSMIESSTVKRYPEPIKIADDVIMVSEASCFVKSDNTLWSCDLNLSLTKVADDVKYISRGLNRGFYIKTDGSLWGWGRNDHGQIGNGSINKWPYTTINEAVKIMDNIQKVSSQWDYTLALTEDGSIYGWGDNHYANIDSDRYFESESNGTSYDIPSPVLVWESVKKPPIFSISLTSSDISVRIGGIFPVQLEIKQSDAYYKCIKWHSLDESIATVSQYGIVTGISEGATEIKVSVESYDGDIFVATCNVTVSANSSIDNATSPTLNVWSSNRNLHINGLTIGENVFVYNISGIMIHKTTAETENIIIPVNERGMYIVTTDKGVAKKIIINY